MKILTNLIFLLIPYAIIAQELAIISVPHKVDRGFNKKFSGGEIFAWSQDENDHYILEFFQGTAEYQAAFDANGQWIYTQYPVEEAEIPSQLLAEVDKHFSSPTLMEAFAKEDYRGKDLYILIIQEESVNEGDIEDGDFTDFNLFLFELIMDKEGRMISKTPI